MQIYIIASFLSDEVSSIGEYIKPNYAFDKIAYCPSLDE